MILYTIGDLKCEILREKLNEKNVGYGVISDMQIFEANGFKTLPYLEVAGEMLDYWRAIKFIEDVREW